MSDHHVVCSTVLSTLSSSFSAYFKKLLPEKCCITTDDLQSRCNRINIVNYLDVLFAQ